MSGCYIITLPEQATARQASLNFLRGKRFVSQVLHRGSLLAWSAWQRLLLALAILALLWALVGWAEAAPLPRYL